MQEAHCRFRRRLRYRLKRLIISSRFAVLFLTMALFASTVSLVNAAERGTAKHIAPQSLRFDLPSLDAWVIFSHPAYRAQTVEETPYQVLRICRLKRGCNVVQDLKGKGGVSISSTTSLGFSPDQLYFVAYQFVGVDKDTRSFRAHVYSIYGVRERDVVRFEGPNGIQATTNNILDWSSQHPHALEITSRGQSPTLAHPASP